MAAAPPADARPRTRWWEWLILAFFAFFLVLMMPPARSALGSSLAPPSVELWEVFVVFVAVGGVVAFTLANVLPASRRASPLGLAARALGFLAVWFSIAAKAVPTTTWTTYLVVVGPGVLLVTLVAGAEFQKQRLADRLRQLHEARGQALSMRLAPHFLFNSLNTLKAQIEREPKAAAETADMLAALFRQILEVTERPTVPLRDELAFVEAYLGIERKRLGKRLQVKVEVPEDLEGLEIPALGLQVLVENAVKHGIARREDGGELRIWARWNGPGSGRKLVVGVENPLGPGGAPGTGTGLEALRGRLARPEDLTTATHEGRFEAAFVWGGGQA